MSVQGKYKIARVGCRLRLEEEAEHYSQEPLRSPMEAIKFMKQVLGQYDREVLAVVNLDIRLRPINWHIVSVGTTNYSMFPISNAFKTAILSNASYIMVFHNHPSGDIRPGDADDNATKKIKEAGELLDIELVDHIIFGAGRDDYYSFGENHRL